MRIKKIFAAFMAIALGVTSFAACGGGTELTSEEQEKSWHSLESGETVFITFAGRDVATEQANYQQFITDFNDTHDNIVVDLQWWTDTSAYNIALDGMGTNLPDVFMLNNAMFPTYAGGGKLAAIGDYLDESIFENLYETGYEVYYFDHTTKKVGYSEAAELYGLPKDQGPIALTINEELLESAVTAYNKTASEADKVDLDRILSTTNPLRFSEFLEIGNKLKTVLSSSQYVCAGVDMQSIVYSNNTNYFTDDTGSTANIDDENFIAAMQFVQDLYKDGILPAAGTNSSAEQLFTTGNAIFYYAGPWKTKDYWQMCTSFTWNILPVLRGDAEGAVSMAYMGGMCYAISKNCKYKDAALELVKYLAADTASQRTQYKRGQCIPNLKSLASEYAADTYGFIANESNQATPTPTNRSVWIDVVDGIGQEKTDANGNTYTDVITGRYRAESYTFSETWYSNLGSFMGGSTGSFGSFWKENNGEWVDIGAALKEYKELMQGDLDDARSLADRF